ncbi:hypothetical protein EXS71_01360 [Candidatus Uhrbacteria bacterium]|nr:hypothetical protein [Candidatus Uhrbacteria bacterium]
MTQKIGIETLEHFLLKHALDRPMAEEAFALLRPILKKIVAKDYPLASSDALDHARMRDILSLCLGKKPILHFVSITSGEAPPMYTTEQEFEGMLRMAEGVEPLHKTLDEKLQSEQFRRLRRKEPGELKRVVTFIESEQQKIRSGGPVLDMKETFDQLLPSALDVSPRTLSPELNEQQADLQELTLEFLMHHPLGDVWNAKEQDLTASCFVLMQSIQVFLLTALFGNRAMVLRLKPYIQELLPNAIPLAWWKDRVPQTLLILTR